MDKKVRDEFIKSLLETLKIPMNPFNIAIVSDEIANLKNYELRNFYKDVLMIDTYGNGMKAIVKVAKKYKKEENKFSHTRSIAKAMYDKFYYEKSKMIDYAMEHRNDIPDEKKWIREAKYEELKKTDDSNAYTKKELYVLNELGRGDFIYNINLGGTSKDKIDKIERVIKKAIEIKYSKAEKIESKKVNNAIQSVNT